MQVIPLTPSLAPSLTPSLSNANALDRVLVSRTFNEFQLKVRPVMTLTELIRKFEPNSVFNNGLAKVINEHNGVIIAAQSAFSSSDLAQFQSLQSKLLAIQSKVDEAFETLVAHFKKAVLLEDVASSSDADREMSDYLNGLLQKITTNYHNAPSCDLGSGTVVTAQIQANEVPIKQFDEASRIFFLVYPPARSTHSKKTFAEAHSPSSSQEIIVTPSVQAPAISETFLSAQTAMYKTFIHAKRLQVLTSLSEQLRTLSPHLIPQLSAYDPILHYRLFNGINAFLLKAKEALVPMQSEEILEALRRNHCSLHSILGQINDEFAQRFQDVMQVFTCFNARAPDYWTKWMVFYQETEEILLNDAVVTDQVSSLDQGAAQLIEAFKTCWDQIVRAQDKAKQVESELDKNYGKILPVLYQEAEKISRAIRRMNGQSPQESDPLDYLVLLHFSLFEEGNIPFKNIQLPLKSLTDAVQNMETMHLDGKYDHAKLRDQIDELIGLPQHVNWLKDQRKAMVNERLLVEHLNPSLPELERIFSKAYIDSPSSCYLRLFIHWLSLATKTINTPLAADAFQRKLWFEIHSEAQNTALVLRWALEQTEMERGVVSQVIQLGSKHFYVKVTKSFGESLFALYRNINDSGAWIQLVSSSMGVGLFYTNPSLSSGIVMSSAYLLKDELTGNRKMLQSVAKITGAHPQDVIANQFVLSAIAGLGITFISQLFVSGPSLSLFPSVIMWFALFQALQYGSDYAISKLYLQGYKIQDLTKDEKSVLQLLKITSTLACFAGTDKILDIGATFLSPIGEREQSIDVFNALLKEYNRSDRLSLQSTKDEIRSAYRNLGKLIHPDHHESDGVFEKLAAAYDILKKG